MGARHHLGWAALAVGLVFGHASPVLAEAVVVVQVRTPDGKVANGEVALERRGDERRHTCTTEEGSCRMEDVPGGRYEVHLKPEKGEPPPPRRVMIPPSGKVTLIVSTGG